MRAGADMRAGAEGPMAGLAAESPEIDGQRIGEGPAVDTGNGGRSDDRIACLHGDPVEFDVACHLPADMGDAEPPQHLLNRLWNQRRFSAERVAMLWMGRQEMEDMGGLRRHRVEAAQ